MHLAGVRILGRIDLTELSSLDSVSFRHNPFFVLLPSRKKPDNSSGRFIFERHDRRFTVSILEVSRLSACIIRDSLTSAARSHRTSRHRGKFDRSFTACPLGTRLAALPKRSPLSRPVYRDRRSKLSPLPEEPSRGRKAVAQPVLPRSGNSGFISGNLGEPVQGTMPIDPASDLGCLAQSAGAGR